MTKLRSIKKSQLKESAYVRKCSLTELTELLKLRLHMTPLKCNYGSKSKCKICMLAEESDEHMLECPAARIKVGYEINASMNTESKCELKEISRYMESVIKIIVWQYTSLSSDGDCMPLRWIVRQWGGAALLEDREKTREVCVRKNYWLEEGVDQHQYGRFDERRMWMTTVWWTWKRWMNWWTECRQL